MASGSADRSGAGVNPAYRELELIRIGRQGAAEAIKPSRGTKRCCWVFCCLVWTLVPFLIAASACALVGDDPWRQSAAISGADARVGWWNMPVQQSLSVQEELKQGMGLAFQVQDTTTWGSTKAPDAAARMYRATRIDGVWHEVPEALRGVFWLRGGSGQGQLVSLQYGRWFDREQRYVLPMAPFMWAWSEGYDSDGGFVFDQDATLLAAQGVIDPALAINLQFGTCPPGARCARDSTMSYAHLRADEVGRGTADTTGLLDLAAGGRRSWAPTSMSLQALAGSDRPGSQWVLPLSVRLGSCECFELQSFSLTKVIDRDGSALEPAYSEFVGEMGGVDVLLWTGFVDEDAKVNAAAEHQAWIGSDDDGRGHMPAMG